MYSYASIDFETFSQCDLTKCGADVYAEDITTEVLCLAYAFNEDPIKEWLPGDELPIDLIDHVRKKGIIKGHNSGAFEYLIWNNCLPDEFLKLDINQIEDTLAQTYAMSLPGALEKAAPAAGLDIKKDVKGKRVMLQLCKPKKNKDGSLTRYTPENAPEKFQVLYDYCKQDVEVERTLSRRLLKLSDSESKLWRLDWLINSRGVEIDVECAKNALEIVDLEKENLNLKMRNLTYNKVATCNAVSQIVTFLEAYGIEVESLAKEDLSALLETDLPDICRSVLLLRQEAAKTSTAKIKSMLMSAGDGSRIRGLFQYHGAITGRWAGRRVQLQNLPRPTLNQNEIDIIFNTLATKSIHNASREIDMIYGPIMPAISSCIRGFLCAKKGHDLISCDFSAIEARVLAWLADEQSVLDVFRGDGKIYEHAASGIYGVEVTNVTKDQRLIGKVAILALGYGGGVVAFQHMAKVYKVEISDSDAENIKLAWRDKNKKIVKYWYELENASIQAANNVGAQFTAGPKANKVTYLKKGSFLWCKLPSNRAICYPYPEINMVTTPWGKEKRALTYMGVDSYTNKWTRLKTYGAKLSENITQAVARDILAESMFILERENYPIVMHIHDEIVVEVPKGFGSVNEVEGLMSIVPGWAKGLPLSAEGWRGDRFRK